MIRVPAQVPVHLSVRSPVRTAASCEHLEVGLVNLGNSCYINVVAQCIAHCTPIAKVLLSGLKVQEGLIHELRLVVAQLWMQKVEPPSNLVLFVRRLFGGYDQQDACELLVMIFDQLEKAVDAERFARPNYSIARGIKCKSCRATSITKEFAPLLLVQLPQGEGDACKVPSLQECIFRLTHDEPLDGWKCDECGYVATTAQNDRDDQEGNDVEGGKALTYRRACFTNPLPAALVVGVGRHTVDAQSGTLRKDMRPVCCEKRVELFSGKKARLCKASYELQAVLCHSGSSMDGGHYYAICKHPQTEKWLRYDDDFVGSADGAFLANCDMVSRDAYVAFYALEKS